MNTKVFAVLMLTLIGAFTLKAQDSCKVELLLLTDISITRGDFRDIQELNHNYINSLSVHKLVASFKMGTGQKSKIKPYPIHQTSLKSDSYGSVNGELAGAYLSAAAKMFQTTADNLLLDSADIVLQELNKLQVSGKNADPLLAPLPMRGVWEVIGNPNVELSEEQYALAKETIYTASKLLMGLCDIYTIAKRDIAKQIAVLYADALLDRVLQKASLEKKEVLYKLGLGSLSSSYLALYGITQNQNYLNYAKELIEGSTICTLDSLAGHDVKVVIGDMYGAALLGRYVQDTVYQELVYTRWNDIVDNYVWLTGGIGVKGKFVHKSEFVAMAEDLCGSELCNTLDFMELTQLMYENYAEQKMVSYYERALYNTLYAAYELDGGMAAYYSTMRPGHYKKYSTPYETVSCCAQAAYEFAAQFTQMVYAHADSALYVNMFVPSSMWCEELGISLMQQTKFPHQGRTTLFITDAPGKEFSIFLRHADWSLSNVSNAFINGVRYKLEPNENGYVELRHAWKEGDVITLNLTQQLDLNTMGDNQEYVAFSYGPVLLGADIGNYGLYYDDFFGTNRMAPTEKISVESNVPMFYVEPSLIKKGVTKVPGEDAKFTVGTTVITEKVDLLPWYDIRFTRSATLFRRYDSRDEADDVRSRAAVTTN